MSHKVMSLTANSSMVSSSHWKLTIYLYTMVFNTNMQSYWDPLITDSPFQNISTKKWIFKCSSCRLYNEKTTFYASASLLEILNSLCKNYW